MLDDKNLLGLIPETDLRDYTLDNIIGAPEIDNSYPEEYDIPYEFKNKIYQYNIGACVACSLTAGVMMQLMPDDEKMKSQWFLYMNRKAGDYQGSGMKIREALKNLIDDGICDLDLFNYVEEYPEIKNKIKSESEKDKIYKNASKHKITGYASINENQVKSLVSKNIPVLICVRVYDNFYDAPDNNYEIPDKPKGKLVGYHEMVIKGYTKNHYKIMNWWPSEKWDHELYLKPGADIISQMYIITDKPIKRPEKKKYQIGWNKETVNGTIKWSYSRDGISIIKKDGIKDNEKWYYIGEDGYAYDNKWISWKGYWYFLLKDSCAMASYQWVLWKNIWYFLKPDGRMACNEWILWKNKNYYFDETGAMLTGTQNINGKFYEFDSDGALIKMY